MIAGIVTFVFIPKLYKDKGVTVTVLRAAVDIPKGAKIESKDVAEVETGRFGLPDNLINDKTLVIGKIAKTDISKGDYHNGELMIMIFCAIPIMYAAITDWKRRIIPDWTWITVLLIGAISIFLPEIMYVPLFERVTGLLLPAASMMIIAIKCGGIGGGDIKMMAAMGFCFGIYGLIEMLLFAVISACIYSIVTKQRSVPLAVFLCIGFFVNIKFIL